MTKTVIIDVDGVLTDGKIWYNQAGEQMKGFHSRDVRAIRELVSHGFDVYLLTASTWPGVADFAKRTGAIVQVERNKGEWVNSSLKNTPYIAVGDDVWDKQVLAGAKLAFCPQDADYEILGMENVEIINRKGGEGVVADVVRLLAMPTALVKKLV